MASVDFRCDSGDKVALLYRDDADYYTARNADDAELTQCTTIHIGQNHTSGTRYDISRGVFCFDTSGLDNNCLIQSATLRFYIYSTPSPKTIDVIIKSGMPTYPHVPPVVGDYDLDHYSGNGGEAHIGGNDSITLNYIGLGWINKTGYTKLAVLGKKDVDGDAPTAETESILLYGYNGASYELKRPKLTVVYTIPTDVPAVGNASYSGTKDTFTIASANVSDDGGGYEERGFEYGLAAEPTWAVRETGVFTGTGAYTLVISGLKPSTTYYGRAFLTNVYGTVYSPEWTSFTTGVSPSYGIYEEDNSPTICFYVRKKGGKWSIKHGPYTEDQVDIEITKILTEGKGKYQIKFEADALCSISCTVMTKMDIKARS